MSWTPQDKSQMGFGFLLQEIGDYILQEDGSKIELEEVQEWTPETKHTTSWTPETKHT